MRFRELVVSFMPVGTMVVLAGLMLGWRLMVRRDSALFITFPA
jgi:hypothetical protein